MVRICLICVMTLGLLFFSSQISRADEEIPENTGEVSDSTRADDWFTRDRRSDWDDGSGKNKNVRKRYLKISQDDSYIYWLDTQNVRWIGMPYSSTEYIIDLWVKLEDISGNEEYSYPPKYYMEHFYLRPSKQQIQFLSELEVTGRPQNAIKERPYKFENWENLVPGSIEEEIYRAVVGGIKELENSGVVKERKSDYDFWDDTLRIGGIF